MRIWNEIFTISSNKIKRNYKFLLLADLHVTKYTSRKLWGNIVFGLIGKMCAKDITTIKLNNK